MFYPARMNSVVIGIHNRWLMDVTSALHEQGELEVLDLKKGTGAEIPRISLEIPRGDIERIISLQFRSDRILEILEPYEVRAEGVLSLLFPKDSPPFPVRYDTPGEVYQAAYEILDKAEPVLTTYEALKQNRELQQVTRERIENLNRLAVPGCPLSYLAPGPYTFLVAGWVSQESLPLLDAWFRESGTDEIYLHTIQNGQEIIVLCIGTQAMRPLLEELAHHAWFFRITFPDSYTGMPGEMIRAEENRLREYMKEEESLTAHLISMAKSYLTPLRAIREELSIWRDRYEVSRSFGSSRDVVYLHGWIREKDLDRLHDVLKKVTSDEFFLFTKPAEPEDDVPVRYDNPRWLAPFEILTTTFSRPRYNEIDPTPFFAPAYLLFFGLMLGDAGYGIIIALVGWLLYRGPGTNDLAFRDMSYILICCGVADIILGTLQGGWFGDLLPRFFHVTPPFVLIEPLNQPILLFQIALIIGTIHINLGILLGLWQNVRDRMYRTAIMDHGIWFVIQPAAA
ncbi:V-type ATP synthase subunit I, partial [Methanospirillum hungatei]|uniref:V-type ATP synthase subunit I n=1 Tax=Methanospirillum hungatei TaxID=2203 RepID=UPI0026F1B4D7